MIEADAAEGSKSVIKNKALDKNLIKTLLI
jgi:hypothetical protein